MIQVTKAKSELIEVGYLGYPECMIQHCHDPAVEWVTLEVVRSDRDPMRATVGLCEGCRYKDGDQLWRELLPR